MATRARIGFHAAYNAASGQETGLGNALVGAYLTRIGLPYSAVIYITKASPNSMTWLSLADAKRQGIEVSLNSQQPEVSVKSQPKVIPKSEGPLPLSPQNFPTVGGYAIQVSSQRSSADAQAAYQVLQDRFPSILGRRQALIHKVDLGANGVFYRAMVGPFRTAEEALELCDSLKAAGGLCIVQKN
jgi:cell division septation protein DedD